MAEIENLSIVLSANAQNAIAEIEKLASVLNKFSTASRNAGGAAQQTGDDLKDMGETTDGVADQTGEAADKAETAAKKFSGIGAALKGFGGRVRSIAKDIGTGLKRALKAGIGALGSFLGGLMRIAKFRLFRTLIKDLGQSLKDLYGYSQAFGGSFAQSMDRLSSSARYLRNSLAAAAGSIIEALTPAFETLTNAIVSVLNWFNQLISALNGKETYTAARRVAQSWGESFDSTAESARRTAKEIKNTILGFDEINRLNGDTGSGTGGGTGSSPYSRGYTTMFEERPIAGGILSTAGALSTWVSDEMGRINAIIDASTLALGLILALTGANIPVGLGLIAYGAIDIGAAAVAYNDGITPQIKAIIAGVLGLVGIGFVVGAMLAFSGGHVSLGLGLMLAGISALGGAGKIVSVNWDSISGLIKGPIATVTGIISGALLMLGFVAISSPTHAALGVGLLIAGAVGLATTVAANWDTLKSYLQGPIGTLTAFLSGALLVLGFVAISATRIALGVGLIVAGAAGLAATISARWSLLQEKLEGPVGTLVAFLSGALLALGFVALAGNRIQLGVGLIVAGAAGLAPLIAARWDRLKEKLEGPIGTITALISSALLILGFVALAGNRIQLGIGLIVAGATGLAPLIAARWDRIKEKLEGPIGTITALIGGALLMLGMVALSANRIQLGVGLIVSGAIGLAPAIAARWDRIKEKLEGPIGIITTLIAGALLMLGMVALSANRIQLGVGLIVAGSAGLAPTIAARWNRIQEKLEGPIGNIVTLISSALLMLGVVAIAASAIPLGVGLIVAGAGGLAATKAARWNRLNEKVESPISTLTTFLEAAALVLGIVALVGGAIPLGIGLILAGAAGLFKDGSENWNNLVNFGKKAIQKVQEGWETAKTFVVNVIVKIGETVWNGATKLWDWLWNGNQDILGPVDTSDIKRTADLYINALEGNGWNTAADPTLFVPNVASSVDVVINGTPGDNFGEGDGGATKGFFGNAVAKARNFTLAPIQAMINSNPLQARVNLIDNVGILWDTFKQRWDEEGDENHSWHDLNVSAKILNNVGSLWDTFKQWWDDGSRDLYCTVMSTTSGWSIWDSIVNWWNESSRILYCSVVSTTSGWSIWDGIVRGWNALSEHNLYCNVVARKAGGLLMANGGVIQAYANGTNRVNHGTVYVAGEAGPEVVGRIGNRTEVMNKFQLAEAMYTAVRGAMSGVSLEANFNSTGMGDEGMQVLLEMIQQSSDATQQQNELLRQQNELLRQINDKEFSADITTASISNAFNRSNKRAGITVVPVGT